MSLFLGIGIALAGYFIGDGMKNWKNPSEKTFFDHFKKRKKPELMEETAVHRFISMPKEETKVLFQKQEDIPSVKLDGKIYFSRAYLKEWLIKQKSHLN